jgi:hypothetical protein
VAAALRTPPYKLVLAKPRDDDALAALVAAIEDELPGVVGAHPEVDEFVQLWSERHGLSSRVLREQGIWEDDGEPVSVAGWGGPTPNGIRIGPV